MNSVPIDEVAKWFVVGFTRCWTLSQVADAAGLGLHQEKDWDQAHKAYPFWPEFWCSKTQVRAVVATEFPSLFRFLDSNAKNPEKLAKAIPQVAKLVSKGKNRRVVDAKEHRELYADRKKLNASTFSYKKSREAHKSHQRSAWNVCKG